MLGIDFRDHQGSKHQDVLGSQSREILARGQDGLDQIGSSESGKK